MTDSSLLARTTRDAHSARTFALIPAAGRSRRMGAPKLLLPVGERRVIEWVLHALGESGVTRTLVVVAPDDDELPRLAERAGALVARLPADTADMQATCQHGLRCLRDLFQPTGDDAWLLSPADHPTLDAKVARAVREAGEAQSACSIVVPTHQGRRGHPTWLRWRHADAVLALPAETGVNVHLRRHLDETLELPWPDDAVLRDLDTPDDYDRLLRHLGLK